MFRNKNVMWTILLIIIFLIFIFLSLTFDVNHPFETVKSVINHYDARDQTHVIMLSRISRVLVACLVGASLALGGFIMQLQYQNDLADPTLLGISDGSAMMIVISMIFMPQASQLERMIFSIIGSFIAYLLISSVSKLSFNTHSSIDLPLIGIVISMLLNSITTCLASFFDVAQNVSSWYNSRLYRVSFSDIIYFLPVLMIVICLLFIFRHQMTVYAYGDAITTPLGMNRLYWYRFFSLIVIILTGVSIAVVGRLSFIGLIVPHIIKLIIGKKYAVAIFYVPILGATLVLMSDYLSRLVNYPFETPVGVLIALIGVPIFLHTIRHGARS